HSSSASYSLLKSLLRVPRGLHSSRVSETLISWWLQAPSALPTWGRPCWSPHCLSGCCRPCVSLSGS
ncbi:unnamed protein product, partial [Rangifer tarandus platyrhynchus]